MSACNIVAIDKTEFCANNNQNYNLKELLFSLDDDDYYIQSHYDFFYHDYINDFDKTSGINFEEWLALCFKQKGYSVELTKATRDSGADIILEKNGIKTVVQTKRWKQSVGIKAVREVLSAKEHYKANEMLVITNSHFTKKAVTHANLHNVELWDRDKLQKFLEEVNVWYALYSLSDKSFRYPTCPKCSENLSKVVNITYDFSKSQPEGDSINFSDFRLVYDSPHLWSLWCPNCRYIRVLKPGR